MATVIVGNYECWDRVSPGEYTAHTSPIATMSCVGSPAYTSSSHSHNKHSVHAETCTVKTKLFGNYNCVTILPMLIQTMRCL